MLCNLQIAIVHPAEYSVYARTQPRKFHTKLKPQNCSWALQNADIHANYLLLCSHVQLDVNYSIVGLVTPFVI